MSKSWSENIRTSGAQIRIKWSIFIFQDSSRLGKKKNNNYSQPTAQSKSLFDSVGGVIASYCAVASLVGGACFFIGYHMRLREYESQIEDLKFEKMQLQIEHQRNLEEERAKYERERMFTIGELRELLSIPVTVLSDDQ